MITEVRCGNNSMVNSIIKKAILIKSENKTMINVMMIAMT